MQIHASCAARDGYGVVLLGPSGCGKSDMLLRLIDRGFRLIADDRVDVDDGWARSPASLAGLIEVRGLGIMRMPHEEKTLLVLAVELSNDHSERLPMPSRHLHLDLPLVRIDPGNASAPQRIDLALDCVIGRVAQLAGAFA